MAGTGERPPARPPVAPPPPPLHHHPSNVFGSILRIDPLSKPNDARPVGGRFRQYRIAPDNFGLTDGDPNTLAETFSFGHRSPYRISASRRPSRRRAC